jgi:hypothetical protein
MSEHAAEFDPEEGPADVAPYEPPRLIRLGNLHDLLAGGISQPCDSGVVQAGPDPQTPGCA